MKTNDLESLRFSYKPEDVKVMLIGESPPKSGKFFYKGDSILYFATVEAFTSAYTRSFKTHLEFLDFFKEKGFYLDDLCHYPINKLNESKKIEHRAKNVRNLSDRVNVDNPKAVVIIMKAIEPYVNNALKESGISNYKYYSLPFPRPEHRYRFIDGLSKCLLQLTDKGIIEL